MTIYKNIQIYIDLRTQDSKPNRMLQQVVPITDVIFFTQTFYDLIPKWRK